jgi:putative membrane protein
MTDLVLAVAHHLIVFTLVAVLAAELALCRPGISGGALTRLARVDGVYGACAGLVVLVGISRVIFGLKGPHYYLHNPWFWAKMSAIVIVALLSIGPTISILGWRATARDAPGFIPTEAAVARVRQFILVEFAFLALVLVCAATMARRISF